MKKHTLLLACAMRILLNLIALPMRGAWIEILLSMHLSSASAVAPHAGSVD